MLAATRTWVEASDRNGFSGTRGPVLAATGAGDRAPCPPAGKGGKRWGLAPGDLATLSLAWGAGIGRARDDGGITLSGITLAGVTLAGIVLGDAGTRTQGLVPPPASTGLACGRLVLAGCGAASLGTGEGR